MKVIDRFAHKRGAVTRLSVVLGVLVLTGCGSLGESYNSGPIKACSAHEVLHHTGQEVEGCGSNPSLLILDNNPEGILRSDLADESGRSLNNMQLSVGRYSILASHANFIEDRASLYFSVVLRNESPHAAKVVVSKRDSGLSVEGQRAVVNALNQPPDRWVHTVRPGKRLFIAHIGPIRPDSFFSFYSEFEIVEGRLTLETTAQRSNAAPPMSLTPLREDEIFEQKRPREPRTHKGIAEFSRIDHPLLRVELNDESPLGPIQIKAGSRSRALAGLLTNYGTKYIRYFHPDGSDRRPNSAGWGVFNHYSALITNEGGRTRTVGVYMNVRVPSARLAYRVSQHPTDVQPWAPLRLTSRAPRRRISTVTVPPGKTVELNVQWILAAPSNGDLFHSFTLEEG